MLFFMVGTSSGTFGFSIPSAEASLLFTVRVLVSTDASVRARRSCFLLWRNSNLICFYSNGKKYEGQCIYLKSYK